MDTSPSLGTPVGGNSYADQEDSEVERRNAHIDQRRKIKTSLLFASPPPMASYRKLRTRDKLFLQIQRINTTSRPVPEFDVLELQSLRIKSARAFRSIFGQNAQSSSADFVVVANGLYEEEEEESNYPRRTPSDSLKGALDIATLHLSRCGKTKFAGNGRITFRDGSCWEAFRSQGYNYKFAKVQDGSQQREFQWLLCGDNEKEDDSDRTKPPGSNMDGNKRFEFSQLNPSRTIESRRITASMSARRIDITNHHPRESRDREDFGQNGLPDSTADLIGDDLCNLALVTGIWIAICENCLE